MTLVLNYARAAEAPLEVEGVTPAVCRSRSLAEIATLQVFHGNREQQLGDFFDLDGDPSDGRMVWRGDLRGVHWIGAKMDGGQMTLESDAGRHVGSEMSAGRIDALGSVGDWVGAELRGGVIHVRGDAGHLAGAAYRGSPRGMTGGALLIEGDAGNELAHSMRRGLMAVGGKIGDLAAFNMLAGTLLVFGESGIRCGAGMKRGTLGLLGATRPELLLTFQRAGEADPAIIRLILRDLRDREFPAPDDLDPERLELWHGDFLEGGRGEVFVRAPE